MQRPTLESPSEKRSETNPCLGTAGKHIIALRVTADDLRDYFFGYVHFLDGEHSTNPDIESNKHAPPERLTLRFTTGEVVVLGRSLGRIAKSFQEGDLVFIQAADRRYAELQPTGALILSITVSRKEIA
jgi:hypothetical protein